MYKRTSIPKVGDVALEFEVPSTLGWLSLGSFKDKNIVIYFYYKDMTPACTIQAREFTAIYSEYEKLDTVILGVSRDNLASHIKFSEEGKLPYPLLVDIVGSVHDMYGIDRRPFYRGHNMSNRTTFLIGKNRKVLKIWRNVEPLMHAKRVLETVKMTELVPV
jgi:peroxiredoxin Q/BCP